MDRMPDITDDSRLWDQADEIDEDEEIRTPMEVRLSWICDNWKDAITDNTYDQWRDLRMMVYGASQTLVYCNDRYEDRKMLSLLGQIAFENSLDCIRNSVQEAA